MFTVCNDSRSHGSVTALLLSHSAPFLNYFGSFYAPLMFENMQPEQNHLDDDDDGDDDDENTAAD